MIRFPIVAGPLRILLGAFVMAQVVYLVGSLVLSLEDAFRPDIPALRTFNENEQNGFRQYGKLTAQPQQWKLFAPEVFKEYAFLEVQLRWDDEDLEPNSVPVHPLEPVLLRALHEPPDLNAFVRFSGFRIREYEASVTPDWDDWPEWYAQFGDAALEENQRPYEEVYQGEAGRLFVSLRYDVNSVSWHTVEQKQAARMLVYLRWRVATYAREHPELPVPSQVVLREHGYRIPEPPGPQPWRLQDLGVDRVALWLPHQETPPPDKER